MTRSSSAAINWFIASPDGGKLLVDAYSDPRDVSGYSEHDALGLRYLEDPAFGALLQNTPSVGGLRFEGFDGIVVIGGQSPMFTFERGPGPSGDLHAVPRCRKAQRRAVPRDELAALPGEAERRAVRDRAMHDRVRQQRGGFRGSDGRQEKGHALRIEDEARSSAPGSRLRLLFSLMRFAMAT